MSAEKHVIGQKFVWRGELEPDKLIARRDSSVLAELLLKRVMGSVGVPLPRESMHIGEGREKHLLWFIRAVITKHHTQGDVTAEVYCLIVPEARNLRSR